MSYINENAIVNSGLSSWLNAQIAAKITMQNGYDYTINDYIRMSVNRNANYNVYHSVGKHNRGYIKLPRSYTFTITVPVTSQDVQVFRMLYNAEAIFNLEYFDAHQGNVSSTDEAIKAAATEFKLVREKLVNCLVSSMNDSYEVEGIPMVVFNGTALSNDFVANISTEEFTGKNYGDNSVELQQTDLTGMVDSNYWDIVPTPPAT